MSTVTLSIIMPVFNHPEELKTMIDSILANTYQGWELLAVDDGSEEEAVSVLRKYEQQDGRVHFISRNRSPKGASTCRNIGFEAAQGEFVIFFDSDDYITPFCLEQRVKELQNNPEYDFVVFRSGTYSGNRFHTEASKMNFGYQIYEDDIEAFCSRTLPFVAVNNIYRRSSLLQRGIQWDTNLLSLQDAQFNLECILSGMRYCYSSCPSDYGYRINTQGSVSKNINSKAHFDSNIYATECFYKLVQNIYGHKYDRALYRGMLFLYVKVSRTGFQADFASRLTTLVHKYSPRRGSCLKLQFFATKILSRFLPLNLSRRLPILGYLVWYRRWEGWVVNKQKELQ